MSLFRVLPLTALLLAGCDPLELDGKLSCDEDQPLEYVESVDQLVIDADTPTGLMITATLDAPDQGVVLGIESGGVRDNVGMLWDPVSRQSVLGGSLSSGEVGIVEVFRPGGGPLEGNLHLDCVAQEVCNNLADDDGNGLVDCADPQCARTDACELSQEALEVVTPACSDDFEALDVPVLRVIDEQFQLYDTSVQSDARAPIALYGGAEILVAGLPPTGTAGTLRFGSAGIACLGDVDPDLRAVVCASVVEVAAGDTLPYGDEPVWLEPEDASWVSVEAQVTCGAGR